MAEGKTKLDGRWILSCAAITTAATLLRFYDLALKPLHHDEGVNGWFLTTLFNQGIYHYDPSNYHGPTLYYISLAFATAFDLDTTPVRASVAVFGVLTVILLFYLRGHIGDIGALAAAAFVALSPGMVYISRYFIHEILFVFFGLAIVVSILFFIRETRAGIGAVVWMTLLLFVCFLPSSLNLAAILAEKSTGNIWVFRIAFITVSTVLIALVIRMLMLWANGRPIYILLASASAALLFATKETAFITLGTMLIACVCVWVWRRLIGGTESVDELAWVNLSKGIGPGIDRVLLIVAAATAFIFVFIIFFSSFFTYPEGAKKAIEAYSFWTKTGSNDHTQNGLFGYVRWGMRIEAPILILSILGIVIAFVKANNRFAMFVGLWAFGLFAAYSIIPYKTPWLALSFILPMCIVAGYGIGEMFRSVKEYVKVVAVVLITFALGILSYQTYELNFVRYDDNDMPYVYAHTKREFLDMVERIDHYSKKSGKGKNASIQVVSPDYWPLVWYLREFPNAAFAGEPVDANDTEIIVAKKGDQDTIVTERYAPNYTFVGTYPLRPGVELTLWVRNDIASN